MENKKILTSGSMTFHFIMSYVIYEFIAMFIGAFPKNFLETFLEQNTSISDELSYWMLVIGIFLISFVLTVIAIILSIKSLFTKATMNKSENKNLITNIVMFFIVVAGFFMMSNYSITGILFQMIIPAVQYFGALIITIPYIKKCINENTI